MPRMTVPPRRTVTAVAVGVILAAGAIGCSSPAASPAAPAPASASAAPTTAAQPTATAPVNVRLKLSVSSVAGDFGGYIVNDHTGPAKQTTFNVDKSGKWSKEIVVPNASMVKLDIARIGARCTIRLADNDELLVTDENSCIVGS
jgi:hypothetical protein